MSTKSKVVGVSFPLASLAPRNTVHGCDSRNSHETSHELSQHPCLGVVLALPVTRKNISYTCSIVETACAQRHSVSFLTPEHAIGKLSPAMPPAIARNPRRRMAWMKARAQQARDRLMQDYSNSEMVTPTIETTQCFRIGMVPKRQRSAFMKVEELDCMLKDRVGTPHISELQLDEDVTAHLHIQELGIAGAVDMLADEVLTDGQSEMAQQFFSDRN
jgi:hypothetical protein